MKDVLKEEEIVGRKLRSLYGQYGYLPYKMSKFEEYDLYARNKEFLDGARIVTFNDTDGKLLALKPDITLSIVKNDADGGAKRKVYYNENVYRTQKSTGAFKELCQTGLECIGEIDLYDEYEALYLATASLATISQNFVLDVSHRGVLSSIIEEVKLDKAFAKQIMRLLAEKNTHGLVDFCKQEGVNADKFLALVGAYGTPEIALEKIEKLCESEASKSAFDNLKALCKLLAKTEYKDHIRLDFSVVGSGNYYDGVVFSGFIDGIGEAVLSGGRYDRLLSRMGKKSGAIGFAVYLDLLENLHKTQSAKDVDVLVLYDEATPMESLINQVKMLIAEGNSVSVQKQKGGIRCQQVLDLTGGKTC